MDDFVPGDRDRLFRMAQEHAELLGAARDGRRRRLDLPQGLVHQPRAQAEFKTKYGWDLAPPATFDQLKQIAEFFQGREIDGKTVYGTSLYTERGSEGVTMGAMDVLYSYGFKYENPDKPYEMEGFVNSRGRGRRPRVLQVAL